jgi:hypothetical protein
VNLIEISSSGSPAEEINRLPAVATEVCVAYIGLYKAVGFVRPWLGYFALRNSAIPRTARFGNGSCRRELPERTAQDAVGRTSEL